MRWPWTRREPDEPDEAQQHIDRLQRQQPEVTQLATEFQAVRQRNHLAELVRAALRGAS